MESAPLFFFYQAEETTLSSAVMDGAFNVTVERNPTVYVMDQDTIQPLLVELCFLPHPLSLC